MLLQAAAIEQAQSGYPIITNAVVNYGKKTLTITGTNFGASLAIRLGSVTLTAQTFVKEFDMPQTIWKGEGDERS